MTGVSRSGDVSGIARDLVALLSSRCVFSQRWRSVSGHGFGFQEFAECVMPPSRPLPDCSQPLYGAIVASLSTP